MEGNEAVSESDVLALTELQPGQHLWRVNLRRCRDKLLANPWIVQAEIARQFPNDLQISIQERSQVAILAQGDMSWIVAEDGMILAENDGSSLPWITGIGVEKAEPGQYLAVQAVDVALTWIDSLQPLGVQLSELNLAQHPAYISIFTTDGYRLLFEPHDDPEDRMDELFALLQEVRGHNQKGTLDFRAGSGRATFSPWPGEPDK